MLYNAKGEQLTNLPYVLYKDIVSVSEKIIIANGNLFDYYDLKGNKLYTSKFNNSSMVVTESYILGLNDKNNLEIDDYEGNFLKEIADLSDETMKITKIEETDKILKLYVTDSALEEEGKNGYIYTYSNGNLTKETAYIE